MAFEPKFEKIGSSYRQKLTTTQAVIECKLPANEGAEISKILCANAKAYIANSEVQEGELDFNGFVNFLVIYQNQENAHQSLDYSAEFKDKLKNTNIKVGDVASITATVVDINTTSVTGTNDVKVVAVVEINVDLISTKYTNALVATQGENVFTQTEAMSYTSLAAVINERFEVLSDVEIRDSVSEVLSVSTISFLESVVPGEGYLTVKGGIDVNVNYLTNAEVPEIRSYQTIIDFTQEIANPKVTPSSGVNSLLHLLYSDIKVTTNMEADSATLNLTLPMLYTGYVFNTYTMDVVVDTFSLENEILIQTEEVSSIVSQGSEHYSEKVNGNVVIDESLPYIDEVLGNSCNRVVLASSTVSDGNLIVEGIAYTTVLYFNKEYNSNNSIEVEIPFSLSLMAKNATENSLTNVSIALGDVVTRSKRGKEIEVNATLFIYSDFTTESSETVISTLEVGAEKPESFSVLSIYIAKQNDTLWEISKELNVSPDAILAQNQTLQFPLMGGERVIIYRQQEAMF